MKIFIPTSDKTINALPATLYLLDKHYKDHPEVIVAGYTQPNFDLGNAKFISIGNFSDYPAEKWSDGVLKALEQVNNELLIVLMDDYWLMRDVSPESMNAIIDYVRQKPEVARVDLTTDRLYAANMKDVEPFRHLDIITNDPPAQYACSFQASLWRKQALQQYLIPGESAWLSELNGTTRMNENGAYVIGTRQFLMRYLIAVQRGQFALDGGYQLYKPPNSEIDELRSLGYLEYIVK